jgi:selenocysteine lyase/cysteine desulfurase
MDITAVRSFFPGTQGQVFLDAACVSLMPVQADEALRKLSQDLLRCPPGDASAHHIALDQTAPPVRREAALLIGARPEDIALIESTTHGLQIIEATVPLAQGDKVLVGATDFLGLAVPWIGRQPATGCRIVTVPCPEGRLPLDEFTRAADGRTRIVLLSSVQWTTGFRADLAAFAEFAEKRQIVLVVDAIQQLGAMPIDVARTPVDFLVTGGHKWLNAPVGRGFLYVHPRVRDRYPAPHWGYLNIAAPPEGWAEYFATPTIPAVRSYEFTHSAQKFEIGGTANYPGNVVLAASLQMINALGADAIADHIVRLTDYLIAQLQGAGAVVVTPRERQARSGIVTFSLGRGPDWDRMCLHELRKQRILISQRYTGGIGGLRVSVHFFNNGEDVDQLITALHRVKERLGY